MADGANTILNLVSVRKNEVSLMLEQEPFENADVLELPQECEPFLSGGYVSMPLLVVSCGIAVIEVKTEIKI